MAVNLRVEPDAQVARLTRVFFFEGGKITPLARARVALKRMVRSKRKGKRK